MIRQIQFNRLLFLMITAIFSGPTAYGEAADRVTSESRRVKYRTVDIDGQSIFYREAGSPDAPTLLLLHGFPTSSHMFRNLIPALADRFHLVAPDYPGYGNSSMPAVDQFDYTFDNLSRVIDKFTVRAQPQTLQPVPDGLRRSDWLPSGRKTPRAHRITHHPKRQRLRRRDRQQFLGTDQGILERSRGHQQGPRQRVLEEH